MAHGPKEHWDQSNVSRPASTSAEIGDEVKFPHAVWRETAPTDGIPVELSRVLVLVERTGVELVGLGQTGRMVGAVANASIAVVQAQAESQAESESRECDLIPAVVPGLDDSRAGPQEEAIAEVEEGVVVGDEDGLETKEEGAVEAVESQPCFANETTTLADEPAKVESFVACASSTVVM
ncbi:MAG: hypothetical protein Q9165_006538 [Trypethelium subeluteriae]